MSVLTKLISLLTYSLSLAIVVLLKKSLTRLLKQWISDAIMVSLSHKHEQFCQYMNGTVTFDLYKYFKNNFTTTPRHARKPGKL